MLPISAVSFILALLLLCGGSFAHAQTVVTTKSRGFALRCVQYSSQVTFKVRQGRGYVLLAQHHRIKGKTRRWVRQLEKDLRSACRRALPRPHPTPIPTPTSTMLVTIFPLPVVSPTSTGVPIELTPTPIRTPFVLNSRSGSLCGGSADDRPCPMVFSASMGIVPGGIVTLVGHDLDMIVSVNVWRFDASGLVAHLGEAMPERRTGQTLAIRLPLVLGEGIVGIEAILNDSRVMRTLLLNRPSLEFVDTNDLFVGGTVRVGGRFISTTTSPPRLQLVGAGIAIPLITEEYDSYYVRARIPLDVPLSSNFALEVATGLEFRGIATRAPGVFTVHSGSDIGRGLGVPWLHGTSFVRTTIDVRSDSRLSVKARGDGVTDDLPAIQEAIQLVGRAGGGTVFLPEGTYRLDTSVSSLQVGFSSVMIRGAGRGRTVLTYGHSGVSPRAPLLLTEHLTLAGFVGISVRNVYHGGYLRRAIGGALTPGIEHFTKNISNVFLLDVEFDLGQSDALRFYGVDGLYLRGVEVRSRSVLGTPVYFSGNRRVVLENSRIDFIDGRVELLRMEKGFISGNTFVRDGTFLDEVGESGGVQLSYGRDIVFRRNRIEITDAATTIPFGDHEMVLVQDVCGTDEFAFGRVTHATGVTLSDDAASWPERVFSVPHKLPLIVAITAGRGLGQWRYVSSNTSNTVEIDRPWDVLPDATSEYTLTRWNAERVSVVDNSIGRGVACINFYDGGLDPVVEGNHCLDAGPILMYGKDLGSVPDGPHKRLLLWGGTVQNNLVENLSRVTHAGIRFELQIFTSQTLHGNSILNGVIRGNAVVTGIPNVVYPRLFHTERLYVAVGGGGKVYSGPAMNGILNSLVESNTVTNVEGSPLVITSGVSDTHVTP